MEHELIGDRRNGARPDSADRSSRHIAVDRGPFDPITVVGNVEDCFGLVVLDGFLAVELSAARANAAWLIGAEDIIRPWDMDELSLTQGTRWRALGLTHLLRLDRRFYARTRHDPSALHAVVAGAARTGHWLLAKSLIISSPLIEERLLLLFALYGERWGRVTPAGVSLDLPLTHELLGSLCGARRPSVTHALRTLERKGLLTCTARGSWMLHAPPGNEVSLGGWREYAAALGFDAAPAGA